LERSRSLSRTGKYLTETGLLTESVDFEKALDNSVLEEIDIGLRNLE
jgi:hypothetical protein